MQPTTFICATETKQAHTKIEFNICRFPFGFVISYGLHSSNQTKSLINVCCLEKPLLVQSIWSTTKWLGWAPTMVLHYYLKKACTHKVCVFLQEEDAHCCCCAVVIYALRNFSGVLFDKEVISSGRGDYYHTAAAGHKFTIIAAKPTFFSQMYITFAVSFKIFHGWFLAKKCMRTC